MIVITTLIDSIRFVQPGDIFSLTLEDATGSEILISEKITEHKVIDFIASFRFALEDGTCPGFHLTGIFANRAELPKEIREAVMFDDLTPKQKQRFIETANIELVRP